MYLNCTNMYPLGFNGLIEYRLLNILEPGVLSSLDYVKVRELYILLFIFKSLSSSSNFVAFQIYRKYFYLLSLFYFILGLGK